MHNKAILKYFLDINLFNIPFCILLGLFAGIVWSIVGFSTFGILIGYLGYQIFKKNEYYAYNNLGFTKTSLLKKIWFFNILISILLFLIYILFR